jgi:hypothetical protein
LALEEGLSAQQLECAHQRLGCRWIHEVEMHKVVDPELLQLPKMQTPIGQSLCVGTPRRVQTRLNAKRVLRWKEQRSLFSPQ